MSKDKRVQNKGSKNIFSEYIFEIRSQFFKINHNQLLSIGNRKEEKIPSQFAQKCNGLS